MSSKNSSKEKYLSELSVWALAFGCVIGWGSFVMPGTTFLPDAGPLGTVIGLIIAGTMGLIICVNYSWMVQRFPEGGGSYGYTKNILGADHAFLAAWSLELAYISLLWANATAFTLMARYLVGDTLKWGFHYEIAGYDVYAGEVLTTILIEIFFGLITTYAKRAADLLRTVFAVLLFACVVLIFIGVIKNTGTQTMMEPPYSTGEDTWVQVLNIAILAPWLFVGFETVVHSVDEVKFPTKRIFFYAAIAVFMGMLVYIMLTLTAAAGRPSEYGNWHEYVADIHNLSGTKGMPVFYNVEMALGEKGIRLVALAVLSALSTSVLGFHRSAARILKIMASEGLLPASFAKVNSKDVPVNASLLVLVLSIPMPFLGRTAIGWNADVSTLSAAIVYAYISICTFVTAKERKKTKIKVCGILGIISAALVFFFLLVPNIFAVDALEKESYFMLAMWSFVGIIYYWIIFSRDEAHRFGKSTVMWIMMLFLLFFSANVWVRLQMQDRIEAAMGAWNEEVDSALIWGSILQMVIIIAALIIMFNLFMTMMRREKELDYQIIKAEERNKAKTDFLSNMSHDIRTPMNAIIGFTDLALEDVGNTDKVEDYLTKIRASSGHLLSLINDVLEMSRIESGKFDINYEPVNLIKVFDDLDTIIGGQAKEKKQEFSIDTSGVVHENVICDKLRLDQVLLNLISNAIKYTEEGGRIEVSIREFEGADASGYNVGRMLAGNVDKKAAAGSKDKNTVAESEGKKESADGVDKKEAAESGDVKADSKSEDEKNASGSVDKKDASENAEYSRYEMRVKDNGMGMSPEFAAKIFEAFEREKTSTVSGIQGTGLGMAITKKIVDLMGGTIELSTVKGEGSEFVVTLDLELSEETKKADKKEEKDIDFTGKRLLLVDDIEINREIAVMMLQMNGFEVEQGSDGTEAVSMVKEHEPGYYDAVLMDIQMPTMNGYDATRAIRALEDEKKAAVPILAMTANAFDEDKKNAAEAGMNGHIAKPIDQKQLLSTLAEVLE